MSLFLRLSIIFLCCSLVGACVQSNLTYSILDKAHAPTPSKDQLALGAIDYHRKPKISDALAINYALKVSEAMRAKNHDARKAREFSSSALMTLGALTGVSQTYKFSADAIAAVGLGSSMVSGLQSIFKAQDRAEVYEDAADLVFNAVLEYYQYNPSAYEDTITPNGVILLQRVSGSIHLVQETLTGGLPSAQDMEQAYAAMSKEGAVPRTAGSDAVSHVTVRGNHGSQATPTNQNARLTPDQLSQIGRHARYTSQLENEKFEEERRKSEKDKEAKEVTAQWRTSILIAMEEEESKQEPIALAVLKKAKALDDNYDLENKNSLTDAHEAFFHFRGDPSKQNELLMVLQKSLLGEEN